jgi:hypothetical protein
MTERHGCPCGVETHSDESEYYMVEYHVWREAVPPEIDTLHCPLFQFGPQFLCVV